MKQLKTYLEELFATPATTLGMGNVSFPAQENTPGGSGDVPNAGWSTKRKKRRFKRYKI